ncbi:MAG TPA: hypothetical protein VKE74_25475, partial [Gemmataceae bacterium]|nr:hypothetical protein [Gemmataceae bacterium]
APGSAIMSAAALAAGSVPVPPVVSTLTEGVLAAMRTAKLKLAAALVAVTGLLGLAGSGTILAFTRSGPSVVPAPAPDVVPPAAEVAAAVPAADPPVEGNWTPARSGELVPTAFPDLKPPEIGNPADILERLAKLCPRVFGDTSITIDPADDDYHRLLKARLQQGRLEIRDKRKVIQIGNWTASDYIGLTDCLEDMRAAAQELWANDPKALIPWLEEFVILAKEFERFALARVKTGNDPPQTLNLVQRHRLKVEAALWKAKNAQRQGGGR